MKLLLDENLSLRLVETLGDLFPGSAHVHEVGLGGEDDAAVWAFAKANGSTIVSKDSDFMDRSVLEGHPPKVIWVRLGNCSTAEVNELLRPAAEVIRAFCGAHEESCLLLG